MEKIKFLLMKKVGRDLKPMSQAAWNLLAVAGWERPTHKVLMKNVFFHIELP